MTSFGPPGQGEEKGQRRQGWRDGRTRRSGHSWRGGQRVCRGIGMRGVMMVIE